jgi:hypothetical protein
MTAETCSAHSKASFKGPYRSQRGNNIDREKMTDTALRQRPKPARLGTEEPQVQGHLHHQCVNVEKEGMEALLYCTSKLELPGLATAVPATFLMLLSFSPPPMTPRGFMHQIHQILIVSVIS